MPIGTRNLLVVLALFTPFAPRIASRASGAEAPSRYFAIEVLDERTGRGVPLVELRTVANVRYYTDSAGLCAIDDPVLMGRSAFFSVTSHGYEFPADGFGYHGARLDVKPGGSATVKIHRINVAERLYRITGEGIYRDSVLLGRPAPIREPLLNAQVCGQDSALIANYHDRLHWFFGDTMRPAYPLGQYWTAGATAKLPGDGGLDPAVGVDLTYFTDREGFSRGVLPRETGPSWFDGIMVLKDDAGHERLLGMASLMKSLGKVVGRKLVAWNDQTSAFEYLKDIPLDVPLHPEGHPFRVEVDGVPYFYFGNCWPNMRVKADWKSVQDFSAYEAFTCLAPGARYDEKNTKMDRDASGRLVWGWKRDTAPLTHDHAVELLKAGTVEAADVGFQPRDVESGKPVALAMGSVNYNPFRKRWVMIAVQRGGSTSYFGEVWYAEADKPEGPWPTARKILTHDRYSFYNPVQHTFFDQQGGRIIYFQGTYVTTFSRGDHDDPTPRYDYNQVMYRLDLADERLRTPPVK